MREIFQKNAGKNGYICGRERAAGAFVLINFLFRFSRSTLSKCKRQHSFCAVVAVTVKTLSAKGGDRGQIGEGSTVIPAALTAKRGQ